MTKKDYILIAAALNRSKPESYLKGIIHSPNLERQWECDVEHIADVLQEDNPRFDRDKFIQACN